MESLDISRKTISYHLRNKGKIYIAHVEEDDNEEQVVRGTIIIKNFQIHVLFHTGCTHTFIAPRI